MQDLLYDAALAYEKLKDITYELTLGHKGKLYCLNLRFPTDGFYHLVGIQHLSDLNMLYRNKKEFHRAVMNGHITEGTLQKSVFYGKEKIAERLFCITQMESMLDDQATSYRMQQNVLAQKSLIKADFLFEYISCLGTTYLFAALVKQFPRCENDAVCVSIFKKDKTDYTVGMIKTKVLAMRKHRYFNQKNAELVMEFRSPSYQP